MVLEGLITELQSGLTSVGENVKDFIMEKPLATAAIGAGVVAAGAGVVVLATSGGKSKKKTSKRGRKRDRTFKSKQKHEQRYKRKRKYKIYGRKGWIHPKRKRSKRRVTSRRTSKRGVKYTKNGQPYIILKSGKARFIKKTKRRTR
jgi:hypothetical protein